jgi:hypothetical protein
MRTVVARRRGATARPEDPGDLVHRIAQIPLGHTLADEQATDEITDRRWLTNRRHAVRAAGHHRLATSLAERRVAGAVTRATTSVVAVCAAKRPGH